MKNNVAIIGNYEPLTANVLKESKINFNKIIFINLSAKKKLSIRDIYNFKIYELEKIIKLLKKLSIKDVCFLGKLQRPNLSKIKIDVILSKYINQILLNYKKGDGHLLDLVIKIFKAEGFKIKSLKEINCDFFFSKNSKNFIFKKNLNDLSDIKKGISLLNAISKFDNAQSTIISNGYILGIEAVEGTDKLLSRVAIEKNKLGLLDREGVLVKIPKKNKSKLIDMPVIGPRTISFIIKAKLNGLAIKKEMTIILNKEIVVRLLEQNKLNLYLL